MSGDLDVIVVGAGMAGLAAASRLHGAGVSVRVVEARSRLGGRIWSSRHWPDQPVDMGASWIHGSLGNPLTDLAEHVGARTAVTSYDNILRFDVDGNPLCAEGEAFMDEVEHVLETGFRQDHHGLCTGSVWDGFCERLDPGGLSERRRRWLHAALNDYEHMYGAELHKLDRAHGVLAVEDFEGRDHLFLDGYDELIHGLAQGVSVTTDCTVYGIRWSGPGLTVTTSNGDLHGTHVIVTLPLGVLQAGTVLFDPPLPTAKLEAIHALGSGLLDKCCLRFPEAFWNQGYEFLVHVDAEPGRWLEFLNLAAYGGAPVLVGLNGGDFAEQLEHCRDRDVVEGAMDVLRGIYGHAIPDPVDYQISRWAKDPHALGAYSYNAVGSGPEQRRALAEPVDDRLLFAGEATAEIGYQTVHGALLSGYREADRLLASMDRGGGSLRSAASALLNRFKSR